MPSTSKKQSNFMKAVANNPKFAKRVGVSQKVGKDFEMADKKMGKYAGGGVGELVGRMLRGKRSPPPGTDDRMKQPSIGKRSPPPGTDDRMKPPNPKDFKRPEPPMRPDPYERMPKKSEGWNEGMLRGDTNISGKKKGGSVKKMAKGGGIERKGKTKGTMVKMAKGGSIDGIAKKGKTRTAYPKMKHGGSC